MVSSRIKAYTEAEMNALMKKYPPSKEQIKKKPKPKPKHKQRGLTDAQMTALVEKNKADNANPSLADKALNSIAYGANKFDSYTGAPVREAIHSALNGENPIEGALKGFGNMGAISGKEIASKDLGITDTYSNNDTFSSKGVEYKSHGANVSPADITGLGIDVAADPFNMVGGTLKAAEKTIQAIEPLRIAVKSRIAKDAIRYMSGYGKNKDILNLISRKLPEEIGATLVEKNLVKHINDPEKLLKAMSGSRKLDVVRLSRDADHFKSTILDHGLIGDLSKETGDMLDQLPKSVSTIKIPDIISNMRKKLNGKMMSISPIANDPIKLEKYADTLKSILKPEVFGEDLSLSHLQKLKQSISMQLSDLDFVNAAKTSEKLSFQKEVITDLFHEIKDTIKSKLSDIPLKGSKLSAKDLYEANNASIENMIVLSSMARQGISKGMSAPTKFATLLNLGIESSLAAGVYSLSGSAGMAASATGLYHMARQGTDFGRGIVGASARGLDYIRKGSGSIPYMSTAASLGRNTMQAAGAIAGGAGRSPDSLNDIAGKIQRFKLPRSTEALVNNKEGVLAKISQSTDTPEIYDTLREGLNHPGQLKEILPMLSQQAPELFAHDKYRRFDEIVPHQLRPMAEQDLWNYYKSGKLKLSDATNIASDLNSTGRLVFPWEEK